MSQDLAPERVSSQLTMKLPSLVMFDLDGTLVDSAPDLAAAVDAMLADQHCPPAGEDKVRRWVGNGAAMLVRRALADAEQVQPEAVGDDWHRASMQRFLHHYRRLSGHYAATYPGVVDSLRWLRERDVMLAVVTNKPGEFVPGLLKFLNIDRFFKEWLGGDTLPVKKPDPAPLNYLLQKFQVSADDALMVGDSRNDIEAARAAGVSALAVTYGYNHGRPVELEQPDWLTDNLHTHFSQLYS